MTTQLGFSLTEMVSAILILSLGAVAASETISGLLKSWDKIDQQLDQNSRLNTVVGRISAVQSASVETNELTFELSNGHRVVIARSRPDRDVSCQFDLVARQCR